MLSILLPQSQHAVLNSLSEKLEKQRTPYLQRLGNRAYLFLQVPEIPLPQIPTVSLQPHQSFQWHSRAFQSIICDSCPLTEDGGYWNLHVSWRRALGLICHLFLCMTEFIRSFSESRCGWIRPCKSPGAESAEVGMDWRSGVIKNIFPLPNIALKIDITT